MADPIRFAPVFREEARPVRPEDIRQFVGQRPFRPFRLTLTDGRTYDVLHPELAMVGRATVAIGIPSPDQTEPIYDQLVTVSLLHIMQAEPLDSAAAG